MSRISAGTAGGCDQRAREQEKASMMLSGRSPTVSRVEAMDSLPSTVNEQLQALIFSQRAVAYLQVDAKLILTGAGGQLDAFGLAGLRLGEPVTEQAFFLEGLLPLVD